MNKEEQIQALKNLIDHFKLPFRLVCKDEDKRRKPRFFVVKIKTIISSPVLDYNQMNHFILGMGMANEYLK